jgi:two-component system catabolic regulation response regulator CreB
LRAATGREGLEILGKEDVDLIILVVGLPDMSGFEVCKEIRRSKTTPLIFLTARSEEVDRVLGLELGGDDYVAKPFSPREIVARVRAILRRVTPTPGPVGSSAPTPTRASRFMVDTERVRVLNCGQQLELSRYEYRLLVILSRRPGQVFSREDLMNIAWESPEMSLERTVDTHIKTIRTKLKAIDPDIDPILTHRGFGYSMREGV